MFHLASLLKNECLLVNLVQNSIRCCSSKSDTGIKYHGFTYYPRFPDQKDPPCQPSKLFLLKKIRPVKGTPRWERKILEHLKLDGEMSQISIIKNTPTNNARLYTIKHLIQITPITFPNGVPTLEDAEALGATFLDEHGSLNVKPKLKTSEPVQIEAPKTNRIHGETMKRHLSLKWNRGTDLS